MTDEERSQALLYYLVLPLLAIAGCVWFVHNNAERRRAAEEAARLAQAPPELNLELYQSGNSAYLTGTVVNASSRILESAQVRVVCLTKEKQGGEQPSPVTIGPLAAGKSQEYNLLLSIGCGAYAAYRVELAGYKLKN